MTNSLGYQLEVFYDDDNPDSSLFELTNNSTSANISDFQLTIGDTAFNFDLARLTDQSPGIQSTLTSPSSISGDGIESDVLSYSFTGFDPGNFIQGTWDIDRDNTNSFEDFLQGIFDIDGLDSSDNAVVTVNFSNGATLSGQLPDFAQTSDNVYTFSQSTTLTVDTLVDENDGNLSPGDVSLREAIAFTNDGGSIDFDPSLAGTITLDPSLGQLVIDKSLTIDGPGADVITVSGDDQVRVFNIDDGDNSNLIEVVIDGLTITKGFFSEAGGAGGIENRENLTVTNSVFSENRAQVGAAIDNNGGGTLRLNSIIASNNNGIVAEGVGSGGGAIAAQTGVVTITNSTLSNNSATSGGAIFSQPAGTVIMVNSTVSNNRASFNGGIETRGNLTLTNSTVTDNIANNQSGGVGVGVSGSRRIQNTIIAGNSGPNPDVFGDFISDGYNLIGNGDGSSGFDGPGDLVGTSSNPIDPLLGPLQDNGGPTQTHALLSNSPAIDAGDPNVTSPPYFDQRGSDFPRVLDGDGDSSSVIDIGAFELTPDLNIINGNDRNNRLVGTRNSDRINGLGGNDRLLAKGGDDFLDGGDGRDRLNGGIGNDLLDGGDGSDRLFGDRGNDILSGGGSRDRLNGSRGDDLLDGGVGGDHLFGGQGADGFVLREGDGRDTIIDYHDGQDRFLLADGLAFDELTITQGSGKTSISVTDTNEELASLIGVDANLIGSEDFTILF